MPSHPQFEIDDFIMKTGEDASWCGVLLSGELEAVLPYVGGA